MGIDSRTGEGVERLPSSLLFTTRDSCEWNGGSEYGGFPIGSWKHPLDLGFRGSETMVERRRLSMKRYRVVWETDGEDVSLPEEVDVPGDVLPGDVADWLSDKYGWLVSSLTKI